MSRISFPIRSKFGMLEYTHGLHLPANFCSIRYIFCRPWEAKK